MPGPGWLWPAGAPGFRCWRSQKANAPSAAVRSAIPASRAIARFLPGSSSGVRVSGVPIIMNGRLPPVPVFLVNTTGVTGQRVLAIDLTDDHPVKRERRQGQKRRLQQEPQSRRDLGGGKPPKRLKTGAQAKQQAGCLRSCRRTSQSELGRGRPTCQIPACPAEVAAALCLPHGRSR